jgi:hypothetical protein
MSRTLAPLLSPALAIVLALCAAMPALAATPIDETRPLDPRGHVEIENLKGRIEVKAWDRPEVKITGSLGKGVEKLQIEGDRQRLSVRVKYPNRGGLGFFTGSDKTEPTDLVLMVPLRADLQIDAVSADVDVTGIASDQLSVNAVSGDIRVAGAPRKVDIDSVSGDMRLTLNSNDVELESVSGDIELQGRLDGEIDAETVSGDIDIRGIETRLRKVSSATVSGDVNVRTALAANGRMSFESVSGDIRLNLSRDLSATVRGKSFSGDLRAPDATIERPRHGPGASFKHRYGDGDGEVTIETFSGDAVLRLD